MQRFNNKLLILTYYKNINDIERLLLPDYKPKPFALKPPHKARNYQIVGNEVYLQVKRMLLGDEMGLGKTLSAILSFQDVRALPALVVCQAHLTNQWADEQIPKFTDLKTHIIKSKKNYSLPEADVYVITYSKLSGWVDQFANGFIRNVIFDEIQELRIPTSQKYAAAKNIAQSAEFAMGLSGTPIYNYGIEIFWIMSILYPGCLGTVEEFIREWTDRQPPKFKVADGKALGSYLREKFLFLRRTREEVGIQLPQLNKIVYTIDHDEAEVAKQEDILRKLSISVTTGSFEERGKAAQELDIRARHLTGVSKAKYVAEFVKILLEEDPERKILLMGWHRDVYEIWEEQFKDYEVAFYTGSENPNKKNKSKEDFINGTVRLMIMSLRSGAGTDGLQNVCDTVVFGELDYSPGVHKQVIERLYRPGQQKQVTAFFLIADFLSDPVIVDLLGLKSSQADSIINPFSDNVSEQYSDTSRMKMLAEKILKGKK